MFKFAINKLFMYSGNVLIIILLFFFRFEIFAVIEGDSLSTGQTSQSRTSYLNTEILWGYRFVSCVNFNEKCYKYYVDDEKFNVTTPISIPLCSARNLYKILYDKYHRKDKICYNNIECRISIGE